MRRSSSFRESVVKPTQKFFEQLRTFSLDTASTLGIRTGSTSVAGFSSAEVALDVASQCGTISRKSSKDEADSSSYFDSIPVARYISEARKETSTVEWKLDDFLHLNKVHMLDPGPNIKVQLGKTIDLPTKWKFSLRVQYSPCETRSHIWLVAEVTEAPERVKNVVAKFCTQLLVDGVMVKEIQGSPVTIPTPWDKDTTTLRQFNVACVIPWDCRYSHEKLLTVMIQISLFSRRTEGTSAEVANIKKTLEKAGNNFSVQLGSLLRVDEEERKRFSDVQLLLKDGVTLYAHRAILACKGRSPVFKAMLMADMEESKTGVIKIPDVGSQAMDVLLHHIYTGRVDPSCNQIIEEVIYAAGKYNLPELLEYCDKIMITICDNENAMSLLSLAKMHDLKNAIRDVSNYIRLNSSEILEGIIVNQ